MSVILCNLFHCFDPYVVFFSLLVPLKWIVFFYTVHFLVVNLFPVISGVELIVKSLVYGIWSSFYSLIKDLSKSFLILFSLVMLIYLVNFIGLIPFVFSMTSHLSFNLSFSLSLWLSGVIVSIKKSIDGFLSHMVPFGTPLVLWSFLVFVETVSQIIRPFTLSVRLMANVMAGHLIMNLLGLFISGSGSRYSFLVVQSGFLAFEHCVSLVQAYVFVSLLSLYWDEGS